MKTSSLFIVLLLLFVYTSCKKQITSPSNKQIENITKPITKQDINVSYTITYFSPKAKHIGKSWKEYIDLQNKIYELRKTNTIRIIKQLEELNRLFTILIDSEFPEKLKTFKFERKLDAVESSILDLQNFLENDNIPAEDIEKYVYKILQKYEASKNHINSTY